MKKPELENAIEELERGWKNQRFSRLLAICEAAFGPAKSRRGGGSHIRFKTPWPGDPRINLQVVKGKAKPYQVKQVVMALRRLLDEQDEREGK